MYRIRQVSLLSITLIGLCSFVLTTPVQGYFEDRLVCDIQEDGMIVWLDTQYTSVDTGSTQYCFAILQRIAQKYEVIQADIQRTQGYIEDGSDLVYRWGVLETLTASRDEYDRTRDIIYGAMTDYETELFLSTKSLVTWYLRPVYTELKQKLVQARTLQARVARLGNAQQYQFVLDRVDQRNSVMIALESIKQSSDFESLVPGLRLYFELTTVSEEEL